MIRGVKKAAKNKKKSAKGHKKTLKILQRLLTEERVKKTIMQCYNRYYANPEIMKTTVPFFTAMLCFCLNFNVTANSNPVSKYYVTEEPNGDYTGCFVQYADGSVKRFTTLKLVTKMFKIPHLLADDSVIIYAPQLKAYQNEGGYAVSQNEFGNGKKTFVAKDVLPGFAVRVVKGYLNVFSIKYYNGQNVTEKLFVQHLNDKEIVLCTPELLETLLKDNADALTVLSENNKALSGIKKLLAAVEVFNNSKLLSKN